MCETEHSGKSPTSSSFGGESLARIVRNSAFNALGTALILPFNFIALFTLARRLGKDSLGTFFTIFAISAVIHWVADCGIATVLTHRVARAPDKLRPIVAEATGLLCVVSVAAVALFYLVCTIWSAFLGEAFSWLVLAVAAASMITRHTLDFAANAFRGLERFEFENFARAMQTALFALIVWIAVYPESGGVLAGFMAFMASNAIAAAFICTILLWRWDCAGFRLSPAVVRDWLRESLPLGIGDALRRLVMQLDTLLLAAFWPPAAVGLFSVAYRPLQPLQLLPRTIVSVTFPMMSRVAHTDRAALSRAFARTTNLLWVASLPIAILVTCIAAPMIHTTAGADYDGAVWPLRLLIWVAPLMFINAQLRFAFTALDAQRKYGVLIGWVLASKVLAGLVLIPVWGIYGACIGYVLGEILLCAAGLGLLKRLGVASPSWIQLARAVPAAIGMSAALLPIWKPDSSLFSIALLAPLSLLLYSAICLGTGALPWSDVLQVCRAVAHRAMTGKPAVRQHTTTVPDLKTTCTTNPT
jgi:O-antigen/teichoic acid export membrane protein